MKNYLKIVAIAAFSAIGILSWSAAAARTAAAPREAAASAAAGELSKPLYLNNCARCHGADGKSQTELGRLNDTPDISGGAARRMGAAKLTRLITKGKGSMPGFGKKLSKAQIASIVSYIRGL